MKISILTICPGLLGCMKQNHVFARAEDLGCAQIDVVDIRDYADGCFRKVDDSPYGGGAGLILRVEPVVKAVRAAKETPAGTTCVAALTPSGAPYNQQMAQELSSFDHLILICGHYEGMDERIYDYADRRISLGDFVLSGGEIAAMAVADSVVRLLPGVLKAGSLLEESFSAADKSERLLEYPQYTRPAEFEGKKVPEVLLSGNHEAIRQWREEAARSLTKELRPDLGGN